MANKPKFIINKYASILDTVPRVNHKAYSGKFYWFVTSFSLENKISYLETFLSSKNIKIVAGQNGQVCFYYDKGP